MTVYDPDTYHPDAFPEGTTFSIRTVAKLLNDRPAGERHREHNDAHRQPR
jgi:hypothetical protein